MSVSNNNMTVNIVVGIHGKNYLFKLELIEKIETIDTKPSLSYDLKHIHTAQTKIKPNIDKIRKKTFEKEGYFFTVSLKFKHLVDLKNNAISFELQVLKVILSGEYNLLDNSVVKNKLFENKKKAHHLKLIKPYSFDTHALVYTKYYSLKCIKSWALTIRDVATHSDKNKRYYNYSCCIRSTYPSLCKSKSEIAKEIIQIVESIDGWHW